MYNDVILKNVLTSPSDLQSENLLRSHRNAIIQYFVRLIDI